MVIQESRMVSYGSDVFARDVAAFMDALGLDRAVIVGHSMGATVAQRFAVDYPQRVQALVLEGAFLPRPANPELRKFLEEVSGAQRSDRCRIRARISAAARSLNQCRRSSLKRSSGKA